MSIDTNGPSGDGGIDAMRKGFEELAEFQPGIPPRAESEPESKKGFVDVGDEATYRRYTSHILFLEASGCLPEGFLKSPIQLSIKLMIGDRMHYFIDEGFFEEDMAKVSQYFLSNPESAKKFLSFCESGLGIDFCPESLKGIRAALQEKFKNDAESLQQ